jgi:translation initiation factor 2 alpha subunit (eIF-2alpha)
MTDKFQIYHNHVPEINEQVLVKFTKRNNTHFEGELLEYDFSAIMSYNDATKKKKVYSWNKVVPLNKTLIGKVENIYEDNNCIQLSIVCNDLEDLKPFNDLKILISIIKKITYKLKINFTEFWEKIIHPIDKERKSLGENNLFLYFKENMESVNNLILLNYENYEEIINSINSNISTNNYSIISKIGLISLEGIECIKNTILNIIQDPEENWIYTLKYDSTPYYILESNSENSTTENHNRFIEKLNKLAIKNKIFTKVEFIGKK